MFAIVQARMGSTRLPGKVMKKINDKPILQHCLERIALSKYVGNNIIVATTNLSRDKPIVNYCKNHHIRYYKGSEDDVLSRYYKAAKKYDVKTIIRITSDCPLIDPDVIDKVISYYKSNDYDYVCNTWFEGAYPSGFDVQITSFKALEIYHKLEKDMSKREHAFGGMIDSGFTHSYFTDIDKELINSLTYDYSALHLSVDTQEDFDLIRYILKYFKNKDFRFYDVLSLINIKPSLIEKK